MLVLQFDIYFGIGASSRAFILLPFKVKLCSKSDNNMIALLEC